MMHNRTFKNFFLLLFCLAGLLSVLSPYLHNHAPDLQEHEDCIAFLLAIVFSLALIIVFFFQSFLGHSLSVHLRVTSIITIEHSSARLTRAQTPQSRSRSDAGAGTKFSVII